VLIKGTKDSLILKGDAIRSKLGGLRSNLFVVEPKLGKDGLPEFFVFTGGGFGHGVGMDQSGAAGMADDGFTVEEILNHYYPGTTLTNIY
jgi:SpoIID/LytB domain protein